MLNDDLSYQISQMQRTYWQKTILSWSIPRADCYQERSYRVCLCRRVLHSFQFHRAAVKAALLLRQN